MQQNTRRSEAFVTEADSVATTAEDLAARLEQPFSGINGLQDRTRTMAAMHLREAARTLQQFAAAQWSAENEAQWQRSIEAARHADDEAEDRRG